MSSESVSLCLIQDKEKLREQKVFKRALGGGSHCGCHHLFQWTISHLCQWGFFLWGPWVPIPH